MTPGIPDVRDELDYEEWLNAADSIDVSIAIDAIKQHYVMDTSEVWFALETTRSSSSHSR